MVKTLYRAFIFPYTLILLYFMFLGFGRQQMEGNIVRIKPVLSTYQFIEQCLLYSNYYSLTINLIGNVVMFMPFGLMGLAFPKYKNFKTLVLTFLAVITSVEAFQYFTRMGICDIDDIAFNTFGVCLGYYIGMKFHLFKD